MIEMGPLIELVISVFSLAVGISLGVLGVFLSSPGLFVVGVILVIFCIGMMRRVTREGEVRK